MDFNSVKFTMNRFHNNLRRGALAAIVVLSAFAFGGIAVAQTDLDGSDLSISASGPWDTAYTNTNTGVTSYIIIGPLNGGTRYTYSGALTGNIHVDVTHQTPTNNENRFTISNANNTFTGGLTMHGGILHVTNVNQLVSFSGGLTLDSSVFMANGDCNFDVTIPAGSFGGMRASGGGIVLNQKVTGGGDLVIVTENNNVVTMKGANDYTGVTSIGTFQGGTNLYAYLDLGADYTLPSTTVVEIGKSQNPNYSFTGASASRLNLAGTTQTIAGLYGGGAASITNGTAAAANLTIDLADGASYEYSGTIDGNSATNVTNLTVTGAGNQTLSGKISNASLTKSGSGTLTLGADSVGLSNLTVSDGTLAITPNVAMTVSGKVTTPDSTLDLNGANLTYTSNLATDFNNVAITNTNTETQSILTIAPTDDVNQQTFNQSVSGNTRLVVHLKTNQNNNSRLMLSGANSHTGGLFIEQGTVRVDDYAALGTNNQIDIKHASLMTKLSYEGYTINLVGDASKGERGAIRFSSSTTGNLDAYITGAGSLEIVYDGSITLTNQANDYQGKTYLGNFQWRKDNVSGDCTLNLGASGVLPDTTEVVFGKNAEGNGTSGNIKLDLKGYNETVAGISGDSTKGVITSDSPATLTLVGNGDYTFAGQVTGSVTLEKRGTGTLTISGANTGSLVVSEGTLALSGDNTGAQSITVKEGGTLVPKTEASMATTVNLQTTAFAYPDNKFTKNTKFVISESGTVISVPMTDLQSGTYFRQRFTGIEKDFQSYFTNPEPMSNMDKIANTAYLPADTATYFTEDIWGSTTGDQNNTNLLMTKIVNTTDAPITLDFAYQFHNSAYLAVTDSKGNRTVVMNWETTSAHSIDGTNYSFASSTGSYTFEPDETYTIEARIFRYNRTIGANGGGVNGFGGTLVGMGARVSGTDGEYLPLNYIGDNWTFSDGSFVTSPDASFVASNVAINAGATLLFNTQNNNFDVYSTFSGEGMLIVDPNEGYTHTYSGNIGGSLSLAKYGYGVLVLNSANDMSGTFDIQAGEVVYAQAGAMNLVSDLSINYNAQLTIDLPASDGAAGISGTAQNYGTITVTNGRFRTWGVSGDGTIVMDGGTLMNLGRTVSGAYSAETIIDNAIVIEEGKTGTFNVGWAIDGNYQDSKLQLNGALFGAGDFILETNGNAPEDIANIAPLIANFSSADFTGNVITSNVKSNANGYNLLIMGKENAFGMSVGTLQNGGNVDMNGYNQTFGGLTGAGNLINRGSTQATLTLNIPEGTTSQYDGNIGASISLVKSGDGVLVLNHANDMNGTVDIQAGEVVYAQANAMNNVTGATIAQDAQLTINLPSNTTNAGFKGVVNNNGTITLTSGRFRTFGVTGDGTIVMDGGIMMNLENAGGHTAETAISNNLIINEGKTANFNVGWDRTRYADSKLLLTGNLSGSGTFQLDTNADAPADFASIAPLVAQFASSDFTGNVVTSDGNNMLKMGKENAFGTTVGTLQNGGNVDLNGYNQTFAGLTGTGNLINTGSSEATFTINVPAGETSKYEGKVYGNANLSSGNSTADISFVKTGEGTAQFDANADELFVKDFTVSGGRLDVKEYLTGNVLVNGGVFSPGNSVGTLNVTGNVSVVNGKALFEFDSFIDNKFDVLNILGDGNSFTAGNGMIELYFGAEDPQAWAVTGAEYQIVSDEGFTAGTYDSWLSNYTNLFGLTGKADGLYLVALASPEPGTGVPEPSTWALLLLGAFGLLYFRKRK